MSVRHWLRNQSIRRKLTAIVVVTSGVAVVLASAAFLAYDYNSFRERVVTDLATTADGVGLLASSALDVETADGAAGGVGTQAREALALIMGSLRAYRAHPPRSSSTTRQADQQPRATSW